MNFIKNILTTICAVAILSACSNNDHSGVRYNPDIKLQEYLAQRKAVLIVDENGAPISGAEVVIGEKENSPFPNNVLTTGADGTITVPAAWTSPLPITVLKTGFIKTSFLQQTPNGQTFEVRRRKTNVRHEVKGAVTGFGNLPKDGFIDFGLAISTLDNTGALNFDITQLISEEYDTISVMGQELDIPTNIYVPKQKESYGMIPLTVEKAFYRLYYDFIGVYKVQTNLGKFDFKKVAEKLKNGQSYFEVVNDFEFLSLGTTNVNINSTSTNLNIAGNQKKLVRKVNFSNAIPATGMLFGVTMHEEDGRLLPTDIKLREGTAPQSLALPETAARGTVLLVNADKVQVNKEEAKLSSSMSTALVDSLKADQGILLDRIEAPSMTATGMKLAKPNLKGNLKGFATYAALSDIKIDKFKRFTLERAEITWEIYSPGWIDAIDLPDVTNVRASQRWQVVFYGVDSREQKQFNGPKTLNQATHAVHNSINF